MHGTCVRVLILHLDKGIKKDVDISIMFQSSHLTLIYNQIYIEART